MIIQYRKEQNSPVRESFKDRIKNQLMAIICKKENTAFICEVQGEIIGFINMHFCPFPLLGGKELYISDLLIKESFRGKGIGKKLLKKAEEIAEMNAQQ